MKDSFAPLQRTFDEQNADIAMVNLSLSSYGFMLSTSLIGDSNFRPMITTALNMVKNKEKAVIFYTLPRWTINGIFVVCFKRSIVDKVGGDLSRLDSEFYRLGSKKNFSEFARPLLLPTNNLFILSIRAIAKSILGPVTMHICDPDNALSFKQSQAINLSINSEIPKPGAFFIQRCFVVEELVLRFWAS